MAKIQDEKTLKFVNDLKTRYLKLDKESNFSSIDEYNKYKFETIDIQNKFHTHISALANKNSVEFVNSEKRKKIKMEESKRYDVKVQYKELQKIYDELRQQYEDLKAQMDKNVKGKKDLREVMKIVYDLKKQILEGNEEAKSKFKEIVDTNAWFPKEEQVEVLEETTTENTE